MAGREEAPDGQVTASQADKTAKMRKEAVTRKWRAEKILKMKKETVRSDLKKLEQSEKVHHLFLILWKVDALFS